MGFAARVGRAMRRHQLARLERRGREACAPGSAGWLILSEQHYGGYHSGVPRRSVSPLDPRSPESLREGGCVGGDRMSPLHHGYARTYARHLARFVRDRDRPLTVVEVGILRGTGLCIWAELFPRALVLGLDIDLSHFRENEPALRARGAFAGGNVRVARLDQYAVDAAAVGALLEGRRIDVMIDDGCHLDEPTIRTFDAFRPHLADRFVYFIEDSRTVHRALRSRHPGLRFRRRGELTVVAPR